MILDQSVETWERKGAWNWRSRALLPHESRAWKAPCAVSSGEPRSYFSNKSRERTTLFQLLTGSLQQMHASCSSPRSRKERIVAGTVPWTRRSPSSKSYVLKPSHIQEIVSPAHSPSQASCYVVSTCRRKSYRTCLQLWDVLGSRPAFTFPGKVSLINQSI